MQSLRRPMWIVVFLGCLLASPPAAVSAMGRGLDGRPVPPADPLPELQIGPRHLSPGPAGIGRRIPAITVKDLDGSRVRLFDSDADQGTVVFVRNPACVIARLYGRQIRQMARTYGELGFRFVFVYPSAHLSQAQRLADRAFFGIDGTYVHRGSTALAQHLGAANTGEVFVLDRQHGVRYRGAIDDQYGSGFRRAYPTARYLRNALDALLANETPEVGATTAPCCQLGAEPGSERAPLPDGHLLS